MPASPAAARPRCPRRRRVSSAVPPARAIRPRIDSAIPCVPVGQRVRVEARAAVAHVDRDLVVADVDEGGDLVGAGVLGGVRHRLARGEHERLDPLVERHVAGADELDRDAVQLLDLGRGRRRSRTRGSRPRPARRGRARRAARAPAGGRARRRAAGRRPRAGRARASAARSRGRARPSRRAPRSGCGRCARRSRSAASRQAQGPSTSSSAIATALDSKAASRPSAVAFWSTKTTTPTATSDRPATTAAPLRPLASRIPGAAERGRPDQRVGEAEAPERDRAGERERDVAEQPAPRRRRRAGLRLEREPGAAVGDDPGAAREREQGEREPDERRVDPRLRPMPAQTPAIAPSPGARRR